MGDYTSIRGWIGCRDSMVEPIREVIRRAPERAEQMEMSRDQAEFYNQGWVVPDDHINWTHYLFYGADVRTYYSGYIRAQLEEIAQLSEQDYEFVDYPEGAFYVDDDGGAGERRVIWILRDGELLEYEQP
ncbi:hypothetical protein AWN76_005435 [Rhodothermaceae bacterium RA]|nr:hypothetical protein AWN76_005435 [Rhodothermaceae bacterium RA]